MNQTYPYIVQPLNYAYDGLEPHIDARTMYYHHDKHYAGYVGKLNSLLKEHKQLQRMTLNELLADPEQIPEEIRTDVLNNGGGVFNHLLYFDGMAPESYGSPLLREKLIEQFGSMENWRCEMSKAAMEQFGSGWAALVLNEQGELVIVKLSNQETVLPEGLVPIFLLDVWEHAYYLKHQNRRQDYIDSWFYVINWEEGEKRYLEGIAMS